MCAANFPDGRETIATFKPQHKNNGANVFHPRDIGSDRHFQIAARGLPCLKRRQCNSSSLEDARTGKKVYNRQKLQSAVCGWRAPNQPKHPQRHPQKNQNDSLDTTQQIGSHPPTSSCAQTYFASIIPVFVVCLSLTFGFCRCAMHRADLHPVKISCLFLPAHPTIKSHKPSSGFGALIRGCANVHSATATPLPRVS